MTSRRLKACAFMAVTVAMAGCSLVRNILPGPQDEAKAAGKRAADLAQTDVDVFKDMDNGIALTPDEVKGRNTWITWTGVAFVRDLNRRTGSLIDAEGIPGPAANSRDICAWSTPPCFRAYRDSSSSRPST
jgi:hypothetical protein